MTNHIKKKEKKRGDKLQTKSETTKTNAAHTYSWHKLCTCIIYFQPYLKFNKK